MMVLLYPFEILLSFFASFLRLGAGAAGQAAENKEPIILYEFEGCPFCRIVREAVSEAGVAAVVRPCPKAGKRFRPAVKEMGGKAQFPYLIDPNKDIRMYESSDIAAHMRNNYGGKSRPLVHWMGPLNLLTSQLANMLRLMSGTLPRKSAAPDQLLEFTGSERHPGARLVRERLCEMQVEYLWRPRANEGGASLRLYDPNTGESRTGSLAIRQYLNKTYRP